MFIGTMKKNWSAITNEPYHEKTNNLQMENKVADQLCSNCTADQHLCFRYTGSTIPLLKSVFVFATQIVQCLLLNP